MTFPGMPIGGFLAAQAMAMTSCPRRLALDAAAKIFARYESEVPTDDNWLDMVLETVALIREYESDPSNFPDLARLEPPDDEGGQA